MSDNLLSTDFHSLLEELPVNEGLYLAGLIRNPASFDLWKAGHAGVNVLSYCWGKLSPEDRATLAAATQQVLAVRRRAQLGLHRAPGSTQEGLDEVFRPNQDSGPPTRVDRLARRLRGAAKTASSLATVSFPTAKPIRASATSTDLTGVRTRPRQESVEQGLDVALRGAQDRPRL